MSAMKRHHRHYVAFGVLMLAGSAGAGWHAGGIHAHKPEPIVGDAVQVVRWDAPAGNAHEGLGLVVSYDGWPGSYDDAVMDCLARGGEPIAYTWVADTSKLVCERVEG